MKRICCLICASFMFVLCACGSNPKDYHYEKTNVNETLDEAKKLFDNGEFEESLVIYLEAMKEEPKNLDARIGEIKCQIELENYNMAVNDLGLAIQIAPKEIALYDLYIEISRLTENISYAQTAVNYAKMYNVEEFLRRVPQKPTANYESGKYDKRLSVEFQTEDNNSEIHFNAYKVDQYNYKNLIYEKPWLVTTGETKLSAYCIKDGIPSETVEVNYTCEYAPTEVCFEEPLFERLVRNELEKEEGAITDIDCEHVSSLYISSYYLRTEDMDYDEYSKLQVSTLNDLYLFPNLDHIYISDQTEIKDFSPIGECWRIGTLQLNGCGIKEIDFITKMPNLSALYLGDNKVSDITPILECEKIRYLDISRNPISDASGLTVLENLITLGFSCEQFNDMNTLSQFENLIDLEVYWRDEADLAGLEKLTDIEQLSLEFDIREGESYSDRKYLKDISFVTNLTKLNYLRIYGLEDMSVAECLKNLTDLETLYLYNRKLSDNEKDDAIAMELQKALPNCDIRY